MKKLFPFLTLFLLFQVDFTYLSAQEEIVQYGKIVSSSRREMNSFANDVDMSDDYMIIGSYQDYTDENGENILSSAGAAYMYRISPSGEYEFSQKLCAPERKIGRFGTSVSISGRYALIGSRQTNIDSSGYEYTAAGEAHLFKLDGEGSWNCLQRIYHPDISANKGFGQVVKISGNWLFITSSTKELFSHEKYVSVYRILPDDSIEYVQELEANGDNLTEGIFGQAIECYENTLVVYDMYASFFVDETYYNQHGLLFQFELQGDTFVQAQQIVLDVPGGSYEYPYSIAMNENILVVGAPGADYNEEGLEFMESSGIMYTLEKNSVSGLFENPVKHAASSRAALAEFGRSVSIHNDYIAVGAKGESTDANGGSFVSAAGAGYLFKYNSDLGWVETAKYTANDRNIEDETGRAIANRDNLVLISSMYNDDNEFGGDSIYNAGAAYFFGPSALEIVTNLSSFSDCISDESVQLTVSAKGLDVNYQWYKNWVAIPGADENSLSLLSYPANNGEYFCLMYNDYDTLSSDTITGTFLAETQIVSDPSSSSVCETEGTIELSVEAAGGNLSYTWYKDEVVLAGENLASLQIELDTENSGNYRCDVAGTCGSASSDDAIVEILQSTGISAQPQDQSACAGEGSLVLSVDGIGEDLLYQWYKENVLIEGETAAILQLALETSHNGDYHCELTGSCGSVNSETANIDIMSPVSINSQPSDQSACVGGGNVTFTVGLEGDVPEYVWHRDGEVFETTTLPSLQLACIPENAGTYNCRIEGPCNTLTTDDAVLTIHNPMAITTQPSSVQTQEGLAATLSIEATGDEIVYQWRKGGTGLSDTDNLIGTQTNKLILLAVGTADAGNYTCMLSNECGVLISEEAAIELVLGNKLIEGSGVKLYPNPVENGVLQLEFASAGEHRIQLISLGGAILLDKLITGYGSELDVSGVPEGLYFIVIGTDEKMSRHLISIQ